MKNVCSVLMIMLAMATGCSEPAATSTASQPATDASPPPPPPSPVTVTPDAQPAEPENTVVEPVDDGSVEVAKRGVGEAAQAVEPGGLYTTPISVLLGTQGRLVFEVQIPQAMQLFKAAEGRPPKSHEEFMKKIIQVNSIPLPKLPAGDEYFYDPERGELMVRHTSK